MLNGVQCVFESEDLPCILCHARGVLCGPKVHGEKTEALKLKVPHRGPKIMSLEDQYIDFFALNGDDKFLTTFVFGTETIAWRIIHPIRLPLVHSSKALHLAVAAFAAVTRGGDQSREHSNRYIDDCLAQTQIEIDTAPTVALAYVSFLLFRICLLVGTTLGNCFIHMKGLQMVMVYLVESNSIPPDSWEWYWLKALWLEALARIYDWMIFKSPTDIVFASRIQAVCTMLHSSLLFDRLKYGSIINQVLDSFSRGIPMGLKETREYFSILAPHVMEYIRSWQSPWVEEFGSQPEEQPFGYRYPTGDLPDTFSGSPEVNWLFVKTCFIQELLTTDEVSTSPNLH